MPIVNVMQEHELKNAYIWIPFPESIVLDKSSITLTTIWQTEQLTATIEPTISDHSITWSSDDTTVATVSTSWLVTCVTPWECTIIATTVNGLTATCYVSDVQPRTPWANTLLYLPLDTTNTVNDLSGNNRNMTNNGHVSFWIYDWVDCAYFWTTAPYWLKNTSANIINGQYTYLAWVNADSSNSWNLNPRIFWWTSNRWIMWNRENSVWIYPGYWSNTWVPVTTWWHLVAFVGDTTDGSYSAYKDGEYLNSWTWATGSRNWIVIGTNEWNNSNSSDRFCGYMSAVIYENKQRTATEINDYYNQTKSLYWIS